MPPCDEPVEEVTVIEYGFNPCFNGCRPATLEIGCDADRKGEVSILVLMDAALRQVEHCIYLCHLIEFQSLF